MTKKELIEKITEILKNNPEIEVYVPQLQSRLRNGRWGMHAYALCYNSGEVMCRPWAGAKCYWRARLERLTKTELEYILKLEEKVARNMHIG